MAIWTRKYKFTINHTDCKFEYDTASELGEMVAESGSTMGNPYDPDFVEHDEFNEAYWKAKEDSRR